MNTDEQLSTPNPPSAPYLPLATRTGLLISAIVVGIGLISYLLGYDEMMLTNASAKWTNTIIAFILPFFIIIYTCFRHRNNDLGGYIGLGRCIGLGTTAGIVAGLISGIWTYCFFEFIAPEMLGFVKEQSLKAAVEQGQDVDAAESQLEQFSFLLSSGFFAIISFVSYLLLGFAGGLLGGMFAQKERPYM
jgi:Protein of unknown function (DUF4199)